MFDFTRREQILVLALIVIFIVASGLLIYQRYNAVKELESELQDAINSFKLEPGPAVQTLASVETEGQKPETPELIIVHVSGAVTNPGVYSMEKGDRVIDAVEKAGGFLEEADPDAVNLAKKLRDEEKIYIPKKGELSPERFDTSTTKDDERININSAGVSELETLPGIGPALAQRIVDYREKHGKFKSIEELSEVSGIGPKRLDDIRDLIKVY
ncbi:MAG: competence protein ComEA [Thermosediminibacterales bacterium]|nr:competence protein ComEA [Thermosediminibacterales bacterium]MDK2835492.1 competence protein ComEA [Thermosediminibacterales bacterium]